MVVDEDLEGNQTRRFLIYDLVALNKTSLAERPWKVCTVYTRACVCQLLG